MKGTPSTVYFITAYAIIRHHFAYANFLFFIFSHLFVSLIVLDGIKLHEECHDGEIMFAIRSYIAENEDALDLVEGEKIYVIGIFICYITPFI